MSTYAPDGLMCYWTNYAKLHKPYKGQDQKHTLQPIPSDLYQSTLELNTATTKLLKIHVYYTTSRILVQGKACCLWVEKEFVTLRDIVHTIFSCSDKPDSLTSAEICQPDPSTAVKILASGNEEDPDHANQNMESKIQSKPAVLSIADVALTSGEPELNSPHEENDGRIMEKVDGEENQRANNVCFSHSPCPSPSSSSHSATPPATPHLPSSPSPTSPTEPADLLLYPASTSPTSHNPPSPLSIETNHLDKESFTANFPPSLSSPSLSDQGSLLPQDKSTHVLSPESDKVFVNINPSSDVTEEENYIILNSVSSLIKIKECTTQDTENTMNDNASDISDTQTNDTCDHSDCVTKEEFEATKHSMQVEITALRSALNEAKQSFKIELDALTTQFHHLQSVNSKSNSSNQKSKNKPLLSPSSSKSKTKSKQLATQHTHSQNNHLSNNISHSHSPTPHNSVSLDNDISTTTVSEHSEGQSVDTTKPTLIPPSLQKIIVARDTTHIILGDSVIKGINLSISTPSNSSPQKVCVSGLKVPELREWLIHQTPTNSVKEATVHVGINDCRQPTPSEEGGISSDKWTQLLSECRRAFPKARLQASGIVLARGHNPVLNSRIQTSNSNLLKACSSENVHFIDHTNIFRTSRGAPRMALYQDTIHPSRRGTARLAENLFQFSNKNSSSIQHQRNNTIKNPAKARHYSPPEISFKTATNFKHPSSSLHHPPHPHSNNSRLLHSDRDSQSSCLKQQPTELHPSSASPPSPWDTVSFPPLPNQNPPPTSLPPSTSQQTDRAPPSHPTLPSLFGPMAYPSFPPRSPFPPWLYWPFCMPPFSQPRYH